MLLQPCQKVLFFKSASRVPLVKFMFTIPAKPNRVTVACQYPSMSVQYPDTRWHTHTHLNYALPLPYVNREIDSLIQLFMIYKANESDVNLSSDHLFPVVELEMYTVASGNTALSVL